METKTKAILDGEEPPLTTAEKKFDFNRDNKLGPFEKTIKNAYDFCNGIFTAQNLFHKQQSDSYETAIKTTQKYSLWTVLGMAVFFLGSAIFFLVQ